MTLKNLITTYKTKFSQKVLIIFMPIRLNAIIWKQNCKIVISNKKLNK